MTKLDKIDAEAGNCQDNGDADYWMRDYAALLIRAVRQLGASHKEAEAFGLELAPIDHDVLALITEEPQHTWRPVKTALTGSLVLYYDCRCGETISVAEYKRRKNVAQELLK